jgi:hypothetical protein
MTIRGVAFGLLSLASVVFFIGARANAETCFHTCFREKPKSVDVDDQTLREDMQSCREACEKEAHERLKENGYAEKVAACIPEAVSLEDLKKIRSASPSVVAFANSFTWDVNNILPDKIIRRVELGTQNMSLEDVIISATGIIAPGESGTFYMGSIPDGYPSLRVTTRVKAIYACSTN